MGELDRSKEAARIFLAQSQSTRVEAFHAYELPGQCSSSPSLFIEVGPLIVGPGPLSGTTNFPGPLRDH